MVEVEGGWWSEVPVGGTEDWKQWSGGRQEQAARTKTGLEDSIPEGQEYRREVDDSTNWRVVDDNPGFKSCGVDEGKSRRWVELPGGSEEMEWMTGPGINRRNRLEPGLT